MEGPGEIPRARPHPPRKEKETGRPRARQQANIRAEGTSGRSHAMPIWIGQVVQRKSVHTLPSKMPDRHFLCGCKDHRYGQCSRKAAPKPKGARVSLAEVAEEVSEESETEPQASAVSTSQAGSGECYHEDFFSYPGATRDLLPADWLTKEKGQEKQSSVCDS